MPRRRLLLLAGTLGVVLIIGAIWALRARSNKPQIVVGPTATPRPAVVLPTLTPGGPTPSVPPRPRPSYVPVVEGVVAPIVIEQSPAQGAELAPAGDIKLVFDRPMDQAAVAQAFTVSPKIAGKLSWSDARTVRFQPDQPLARNTVFDVVLDQAAKDQAGTPLNGAYQFRFATTGYLEVGQVSPAPSTNDAAANSSITVSFSRPVVALTTAAQQAQLPQPLRLLDGQGQTVAGQGEWLNTAIYVFRPAQALAGGTTYTGIVDQKLTDTDGNPQQNEYRWQFAIAPPQVLNVVPNENATLISVEPTLSIIFNQPIDQASAEAAFSLSDGKANIPGTLNVVGETLIFTPAARLQFDTAYTGQIAGGLSSATQGTGLPQPYSWRFRTVPLPKIESTSPANGERNAPAYSGFAIKFNAPINPATVERNLAMTPPLSPTLVYTYYNEYDQTFILNFGARPSQEYEVRIGPDIADPYGNTIGQGRTVRFRTAPAEPMASLVVPGDVGTYNAAQPARVVISAINSKTARLSLYRLQAQDLARSTGEWYSTPPGGSTRLRQWDATLAAPPDQLATTIVDLVENGGKLDPGVYLLALNEQDQDRRRYHTLVVSDLHLTLKSGPREVLVWANQLSDGAPVANLPLTLWTGERDQLGSATTDANGIARWSFDPPSTSSRLVLAEQPFAAVSDSWTNGIGLWELGINQSYDNVTQRVGVYTDRPLYRPGQQIAFKGVVRQEQDVQFSLPPSSRKVTIVLQGPTGEQIGEQTLDLSALGTYHGTFDLPANAPLGGYTLLTDPQGPNYHGLTITVAAYRAPEFEVTVKAPSEQVAGTSATAEASASYFFGGPVANVPLNWNILAEPYIFAPAGLERYTFSNNDDPWRCFDCWWRPVPPAGPILNGSGNTNAQGQLTISLPAQLEWSPGTPITTPVQLRIEANATGRDNQAIAGRSTMIVHQAAVYVGLATPSAVMTAGEASRLDLVATDTQGQRRSGQTLTVEVVRYEWTNRFVTDAQGGGRWESREERTSVTRQTLTSDARGEAVLQFTPDQGGSYRVTASASDGQRETRSSVFVWVAGTDQMLWRRTNDDHINLISDRTSYQPGETASILIPSPFAGPTWALITIERGGILKHEVIKLASNSTVYQLPITAQHAPNIFVSVVLFTGPEGGSPTADYKLGVLPLKVAPVPQTLKVTLTPAEGAQQEPGKIVNYIVRTTNANDAPVAAEVSLDLVDKAVLSLIPRQAEVLHQAFYSERGLSINTGTGLSISTDRLIQKILQELERQQREQRQNRADDFSTINQGLDSAAGGMARSEIPIPAATTAAAAPESAKDAEAPAGVALRSNFADTAFWQAVITTDAAGQASVAVTLPDNLTTWVARAVAVTGATEVGEGTVEVLSTKPLLVRPVTPRFLVVGDQVELAANVSNTTNQPLVVEVALSSTGLDVSSPLSQTITIAANSEAKVTWQAQATAATEADLVFSATSGSLGDAAKPRLTTGPNGTLPIYRFSVPETLGTGGQITGEGARTEIIALPPSFDSTQGEVTLRLDPSLAAGVRDALRTLELEEDQSTEQIVSRFLPNVLTYQALKQLGTENPKLAAQLPTMITTALDQLKARQHADGGWSWWDDDESNPHISAYVVLGLARTQASGFNIDQEMLSRGISYVETQLAPVGVATQPFDANLQAFYLYVLGEAGQSTAARTTVLQSALEYRAKLNIYSKALLAMALQQADQNDPGLQTLLADLESSAILSATGAHWEEDAYDWRSMTSDTRTTAMVLQAMTRIQPDNQLNPNVVRWLMVARKAGVWQTSQENAWAIMALTEWMSHTGELQADYEYGVLLNNVDRASGRITPADVAQPITLQVAVGDLLRDQGNRLTVGRGSGPGVLYYTAHLRAFLPVEEVKSLDRGISVQRRYTLASCTQGAACPSVSQAKVGDVLRVELSLTTARNLYYLRVEDPLPAGMESIDTTLATTSQLDQDPAIVRDREGGMGKLIRPFDWWWNWYSRSELRDEKTVLFADYLSRGSYTYSYTVRATQPGSFRTIPTTASETYFPEVYGRSDGGVLTVTE